MAFFDDILSAIPVEEEREVLKKYPTIRQAAERAEAAIQHSQEAQNWFASNWDYTADKTKDHLRDVQEREDKIKALETRVGTEMTFDEIKTNLAKEGYVRASDVDARVNGAFDVTRDDSPLKKVLGIQAGSYQHVFTNTVKLATRHAREWNEDLDPQDLYNHMEKVGIKDFKEGYESFIKPKVEARQVESRKKDDEARAKDIEDAERRGAERARQESAMGQNGRIPVADDGGNVGSVRARQMKKQEATAAASAGADVPVGQGIAYQMYDQLLKDRAAGKVN